MEKIYIVYDGSFNATEYEKVFNKNNVNAIICSADNINIDKSADAVVYFGNDAKCLIEVIGKSVAQNINKFVYVGDVCAYFARKKITDSITKHNVFKKYIEAENVALSFSNQINVSVLEIPNKIDAPELLAYNGIPAINMKRFFLTFAGGRTFINAENVAEIVLEVILNGANGVCYPICDGNKKYVDQIKDGKESVKAFEYPEELNFILYLVAKSRLKKSGKEASFDIKTLYKETLNNNYYFDDSEVKTKLLGNK